VRKESNKNVRSLSQKESGGYRTITVLSRRKKIHIVQDSLRPRLKSKRSRGTGASRYSNKRRNARNGNLRKMGTHVRCMSWRNRWIS